LADHVRLDETWRNRVHSDVARSKLLGGRQGRPDDSSFRRAIDQLSFVAEATNNRRQVDDRPPAAALHQSHCGLSAVDHSLDIDIYGPVDRFRRDHADQAIHQNARIIYEDVEPLEAREGLPRYFGRRFSKANVPGNTDDRHRMLRGNLVDGPAKRFSALSPVDDQSSPMGS